MPLLAKIVLGCVGTACAAGVYAFHDGVMSVTVDENRVGGQHVHLMIPAAMIPVAARFVPDRHLRHAAENAAPLLPALTVASKELGRLADAELVRIDQANQHVRLATEGGYLVVDVREPGKNVHVRCPLTVVHQLAGELQELQPAN
ncbi:MAG TPA: hypothetical protein VOA41_03780 [Candidatus Dormibacteraeota bacterium]|nr:hypothetical protein [Candidatus Dormibacteraeota bacterium]